MPEHILPETPRDLQPEGPTGPQPGVAQPNTPGPADITLSPFYHSAVNAVTRPDEAIQTTGQFHEMMSRYGGESARIILYLRRNAQDEPVHISRMAEDLGVCEDTLRRSLGKTDGYGGLVERVTALTPEDAHTVLSQKVPQDFTRHIPGLKKCQWCGSRTLLLHRHHYPISGAEGGTETVNICPNCHTEYHALTTGGFIPCLTAKADSLFAEVRE